MQEQMSTHNITVTWRGKKFIVEMNSGASLKDLGHELQKLTDVKADTMRLIVPQASNKSSKLLSPFSDEHSSLYLQETSFFEGKSIRMMGVPKDEVDEVVQNAKANLRIAGFEEEERRMRQRMLDRSHGSLKLPQGQYIFCDFRTLHIPGLELSPPASEALTRMHLLAADPGIVAIMNKHHWRVGIMTEMAPVGYVGVSPKCILGFNKNHGEEISLRLRTDDLKGFRKYESIKKTLLHELAHMVFSEHDANFFALDKQLNQEAATLDWTRSKGHTLSGVRHSENYGEFSIDDRGSSSQKLGGKTPDQFANARATSVAAAYYRLANLSSGDKDNGPDDFGLHQEPEFMDVEEIGKLNIVNSDNFLWKDDSEPDPDDCLNSQNKFEPDPDDCLNSQNKFEPDPDDCLNSQNKFEPDPDDIEGVEAMESEPYLESTGGLNISEPDPDDSHITEFLPPVTKREIARSKAHEEPDPDNLEVSNKTVDEPDPDDSLVEEKMGYRNVARPSQGGAISIENIGNEIQLSRDDKEPDPDDSVENGGTQTNEPDPDDQELQRIQVSIENIENEIPLRRDDREPDPDDSVENGGTQTNEPDPDDQELQRIQDPVTIICNRLQKAIEMLQSEVNPTEISGVLQTLFKIIRNVIEHPYETKFKRIRKDNPIIKRNVANYKAAMDILSLIGFNEDVVLDDIGRAETYLVLKRNDPGLLWLAKSSLETCLAY